jgi:PEP-CTERM motif
VEQGDPTTLNHEDTPMTRTLLTALTGLAAFAIGLAHPSAHAGVLVTNDAAVIATFQNGLTVLDFEGPSPHGRTPQVITSYTSGNPVDPAAFLYDQAPGVRFSVGGGVGVNMPAIYRLSNALVEDAASGTNVLGPVDFEFETHFRNNAFIEVYFPTKVSKVGFWLNPKLGAVTMLALNTNFAFSGLEEELLEQGVGAAGFFVGIERPTADIGGFKILARGTQAFTLDDFSFGGGAAAVPEPTTLALLMLGLLGCGATTRTRRPCAA